MRAGQKPSTVFFCVYGEEVERFCAGCRVCRVAAGYTARTISLCKAVTRLEYVDPTYLHVPVGVQDGGPNGTEPVWNGLETIWGSEDSGVGRM